MPVCITGMHRSGTSMVAGVLREAGLNLGPDDRMMPAAEENPEGFHEHLDFVTLNEELLAACDAGWDFPPPIGQDWSDPALAAFRDQAGRLVAEFAGQEPWGWKDPRNCLTLPFWQAVAGPLTVVLVVRNPLEVALSLRRRNGFSVPLGLALWHEHAARAIEGTEPGRLVVTHFDAHFQRPEAEARRLIGSVGLPVPDDLAARVAPPEADLKHHRLTTADLLDASVPEAVIALYRELCGLAGWADPADPASDADPDRLRAHLALVRAGRDRPRWVVAPAAVRHGPGETNRAALELQLLQIELDEHRDSLRGRQERVVELEQAITTHQAAQVELESRVAERDRRLVDLDTTYQRLLRDVRVLRDDLTQRTAELAEANAAVAMHERYEAELREMLAGVEDQLVSRDSEVIATLGGALARFAPGAPAAIFYRKMLDAVRAFVERQVPAGARLLVADYGDDAMLDLGGRPAAPYPKSDNPAGADYTSVDSTVAIAQLEHQRAAGAEFLVVPSPAQIWLSRNPAIARYLADHYPAVAQEQGMCTIYDLRAAAPVASA